ncbi:MAG: type IX secretion system protein PorQ [Ignavibacteria bacterium]|nr:type IX secretion system protein PorQ [Ignavibacteria bacterium]
MINRKILFVIAVILSFYCANASAQQQSTYNFLKLNVDARSSAMAGNLVATENDVNTIYYNPAGLASLDGKKASVGFFKYLMDINSGNAAYSQELKKYGYVGLGIRYINYGTFDKFDEQYNNIGTFGAGELAVSFGYANKYMERFKYGFNVKFIYSSIDIYKSYGAAVDLGAMYSFPEQKFTIGASVLNLGTQLKTYNGSKEKLPLDIRIGGSKKLDYLPLTFNFGFANLADDYDKFFERFKNVIVGGEFELNDYFLLRAGYNNAERQNFTTGSTAGLGGFSAGLGIKFKETYRIDYSFNSMGKIGATHRFSLGFDLK